MIKDQFLYFAQYPSRDGVLAMFTNGSSDFPGYNDLVASLRSLPDESRVPEIANYVYRLYQKGGWAVGGTRKLTFDPSTLISPSDHVYLIIGNIIANDVVYLDNEDYKTHTYPLSEQNKNTIEFGIVFKSTGHWAFAGMEKVELK